ncbi:MAG: LytTR family DNA-binding domain-containing protein [Maribacter sp.]|uniref:LytR/AlgR family response regulator transcription factor n=1 Tax=Maribacter sp. TaxID=1897614 RepID=UPI0032969AC2
MRTYIRVTFFLLLQCISGYGQNAIDKTFLALKGYNLEEANIYADNIKDLEIRNLFFKQISYFYSGKIESQMGEQKLTKKLSSKELISKQILISDLLYLEKDTKNNDLIFSGYFKSLNAAETIKDTLLITESLRKINTYMLYRARDTIATKEFLTRYEAYTNWSQLDDFWHSYLSIGYTYMMTEDYVEKVNHQEINRLFENSFLTAKGNDFLTATIFQMREIYFAHWLKNYEMANVQNLKASQIYKSIPFWFAQTKVKGLEYNRHINFHKNGSHKKAITFFKKDLNRDKEPFLIMRTHEWLYKCYYGLKKHDSALYHFQQMEKLARLMKQADNAAAIRKLNAKYNFDIMKNELELLEKENIKLENNFLAILPIFGITSLVLVIIFFLYKRHRKKGLVLEKEKHQTLQKLDELKSIVIKNHVVLKDKTKIYISDLIYIKSDDHYLKIFLSDNKSHLVRGKLKQIREELPPNFIQCHRSYIVNANFIKQINREELILINNTSIPLSRSYRDNF